MGLSMTTDYDSLPDLDATLPTIEDAMEAGIQAYKDGLGLDSNPYSNRDVMLCRITHTMSARKLWKEAWEAMQWIDKQNDARLAANIDRIRREDHQHYRLVMGYLDV